MTTRETVTEVLVETLDIDADAITDDATLDSLGIDSLDMVELVCDIEEKLEIEFGEPEGIATVGDMISHIDSLR